jgi:hypothetical protein
MCIVFVGVLSHHHIAFVGEQSHPHVAFIDTGAHPYVAFDNTGTHLHIAFVNAGAHPHVAVVGLQLCLCVAFVRIALNGVGEHMTPSLFLVQPAFVLPLSPKTPAGGPTPSCLYYPAPPRAAQEYGVVTFKSKQQIYTNKIQ